MMLRRFWSAVRSRAVLATGSVLLVLLGATAARAHESIEAVRYNEVDLQTEVMREVQNDQMFASLYAELQEANPAELQNALNKIAQEAHKIAGEFKSVKVRTGYNQTYPVYDRDNKLVAWRGRTELRLESKDFPSMAKLIARLQPSMQLGGISFGVSPELRKKTEEELMKEAVASFRQRAQVLTEALEGKRYRLRKLSIQTSDGAPPRPMMTMRAAKAESYEPVLEGGTSQVNVGAVGTIEIE
mgnify:FL=1